MNLHPKLIELLNKRGISSQEELDEFLSEKPQKTYDPFLLHNMEEGVDLILYTIKEKGKICIYGDYDSDGITSVSILLEVLSKLTDNLGYYIPSRFEEGYGLNKEALDKIHKSGTDLVITVDCGIVSYDEVNYAKSIGMNIIVTDHHTPGDRSLDCIAINPKQKACDYPCKDLAGCGVAFKLAQAVATKTNLPKSVITRVLDLVGIGTIGDIVPLMGENRTLAKYGLRALNTGERESLRELIIGTSLNPGSVNTENVSFVIVPHLNAAGRMEHAKLGVELIRSTDPDEITKDVKHLMECNSRRKDTQEKTFNLCKERVESDYNEDDFLLIKLEDAHEGITGIVAGKIKDEYNRPTAIITPTQDGCYKGTGRSIDTVNLHEILKESDYLFERFGGHAAACGFTIKQENVEELRKNLLNGMSKRLKDNPLLFHNEIVPDLHLDGEDITIDFVNELAKLEPCGNCNERPIIEIQAVPTSLNKIGKNNQFTRFFARFDNGKELKCVAWKSNEAIDAVLQKGKKVSIIGSLGTQEWNGVTSLQFTVDSVKYIGE